MECRACKTELVAEAAFCHACGARTGLSEPTRKKAPTRKRKADMTEAEWVLQDVRYGLGFWNRDILERHATCREVWDAIPNALWQVGILDTVGYANESALRRFLLDAVAEAAPHFVDARTREGLDTVDAFVADRADEFDLRDASLRANTAAHDLARRQAPREQVAAAEAAALATSPVWMLKENGLYQASIVRVGLMRLGRVFSPHQFGEGQFGNRADEFQYRADDPYMTRLAEALREAIGNPFEQFPTLAMRSHEQTRTLQTWATRTGGGYRIDSIEMNDWRLTVRLPDGTKHQARFANWRQAVHEAYRQAMASGPIPAKRPRRPSPTKA